MTTLENVGGRVTARRLAGLLGAWRTPGGRTAATDLAGGVRLLVQEGRLPTGTRLPAERELADALTVSRTLVTTAMDRLRADGVITSRRGAGSWIGGLGTARPAELVADPELIDLARAAPPAAPELLTAFDQARLALPGQLRDAGYHQRGLPDLCERIAARYRARGLPTTADQIVVTTGAHHAFVLALRTLVNPGDRVLVEQPTYPNALDAIRAANALPVGVPMDPAGWSLEAIDATLRQSAPKLAYLMPDFQNPTGHRMSSAGRAELAELLHRNRTVAVVDETMVEIDFAGDPVAGPPPFARFADATITVGSASKSHWGGLRLGWLRAPAGMVDRFIVARTAIDLGSPVFEQLVLAQLLRQPEPVLGNRRAELAGRRDLALAALHTHCPQWIPNVPDGGLSLWCQLDQPVSTRLAVAGIGYGVQLVPGPRFSVDGGLEGWLRVPFTLPTEQLLDAIGRLGRLAGEVGGPSTGLSLRVPVA